MRRGEKIDLDSEHTLAQLDEEGVLQARAAWQRLRASLTS